MARRTSIGECEVVTPEPTCGFGDCRVAERGGFGGSLDRRGPTSVRPCSSSVRVIAVRARDRDAGSLSRRASQKQKSRETTETGDQSDCAGDVASVEAGKVVVDRPVAADRFDRRGGGTEREQNNHQPVPDEGQTEEKQDHPSELARPRRFGHVAVGGASLDSRSELRADSGAQPEVLGHRGDRGHGPLLDVGG